MNPSKTISRIAALLPLVGMGLTSANAVSLLLDFGPNATSSDIDRNNSPAHAVGAIPSAENNWNTASTLTGSGLVYSDGTSAGSVSYALGRSNVGATNSTGVATNVNFNNTTLINVTTLLGGSTYNSGPYAGNSPMKDGVFANGTSSVSTNALGLRIDGLPAGQYTVYVVARNSNSNGSQTEQIFCTNGPSSSGYNFLSSPSVLETNAFATTATQTFVQGDNYNVLSVTLNSGDSLFLACVGPTNSAAVERRGFLNLVELVSGAPKPTISKHPTSQKLYVGRTAQFSVTAGGATGYQWRSNGVYLTDSGRLTGSANTTLTLANLMPTDSASYDMIATNAAGSITSQVAQLTVTSPITNYEFTVLSDNPVAYYRFNESVDPSIGGALAYDYISGVNGVYGTAAGNLYGGNHGPLPDNGLTGFEAGNGALLCTHGIASAQVKITSPWKINTNTVTLCGWIYPNGGQNSMNGLIHFRGTAVDSLNYSGTTDGSGNYTLGYTWNNDANTYNWNSGLVPPPYQWSLVALVVTSTNATIYVGNTSGVVSSVHTYAHVPQAFNGPMTIGDDLISSTGGRAFNGIVDEVAVFDQALSQEQIIALVSTGTGVTNFPPAIIAGQPAPAYQSLYERQAATFSVLASGTLPLSYQWQEYTNGVFVNMANDARISGATASSLTISNLVLTDPASFQVIVTNLYGSVTSSVVNLSVMPVGPPLVVTLSTPEPIGTDWDSASYWDNGMGATATAVANPGSTFEIVAGGAMRTPANPPSAVFPGGVLTVHGNGVLGGGAIGTVILKGANPCTISFPKLVMAGGGIGNGINAAGNAVIAGGELNILGNTPFSTGNSSSGGAIQIVSQLTGNGSVEYHAYTGTVFQPAWVGGLNIAGTSNTYSGTWNVVVGMLLGTQPNSLGTNTITIGTGGGFQTTYDINNPNGDLILNGVMYLNQNDTFHSASVGGKVLTAGTYSFAQLNTRFQTNFPASWIGQKGVETYTNGSGSITVLFPPPPAPPVLTNGWDGTRLTLNWPIGALLLQATNLAGPWTTNTATTQPLSILPTEPQMFYRLQAQ